MSGFDDYPVDQSQMPARMRLYPSATARYAGDVTEFMTSLSGSPDSQKREDYRRLAESQDILTVWYEKARYPFQFDGSDSIQIDGVNAPSNSVDGFVMITAQLYQDGSPFAREEDLEVFGEGAPQYEIFLSAERQPFIVPISELERHTGAHGFDMSPDGYLDYLREQGLGARDLNDDESQQLLDGLAQLQVDTDATLEHNL